MVSMIEEETTNLIEDERKYKAHRAYTCQNPKRHIPTVSLLLWCKLVTMCCFVWALGLRLWSVSETKFQVLEIFLKFYIQSPVNVFLFLNAVVHVRWTNIIP